MTNKPPTPAPAKPPTPPPAPAADPPPARPAWTQPKPKPSLATPGVAPQKPAQAAPQPSTMVLEEPGHPFEVFLAKEFDGFVARMNAEAHRLNISQAARLRVLIMMLMVRVAAYGVRGGLAKKDILDIFERFWTMQPKPTAPVPAAAPPKPAAPR